MPVYPAEASRGLALDRHEYVAAVLMDLSKAFDSLPHDLLLVKLQAYGLSVKACALISSYLSGKLDWGHTAVTGVTSSRGSHKAPFLAHFSLIYL